MSMEYCVEQLYADETKWAKMSRTLTTDYTKAKQDFDDLCRSYGNKFFRMMCREVGDWCECRES